MQWPSTLTFSELKVVIWIPDRSMLDNLFLMRDVCDICNLYNIDVGVIPIDQEKVFDRIDHSFLFATLQAYGVGEHLLGEVFAQWCVFCAERGGST